MQPTFAYLPAPALEYLSTEQLVKWLELRDAKVLRRHIKLGHIPEGKTRCGGKRLYWDKTAAAIAKWSLDNLERYQKPTPETDE